MSEPSGPASFFRRRRATIEKKRQLREQESAAAHARALLVVRELTDELVARGVASVEVGTRDQWMYAAPIIAVSPTREGACPLEVYAEAGSIDLYLGQQGNLHEIWHRDQVARLGELRQCVETVLAGRYSEQVDPHALGSRLIGRFDCEPEPIEFRHYGALDYGPAGLTRYAAY